MSPEEMKKDVTKYADDQEKLKKKAKKLVSLPTASIDA